MRLGRTTVTDDAEGEIVGRTDASGVTASAVAEAVRALTGPIEQVPSSVSAIKVDGRRSYARVRAGEDVALPARPVTVHRFDVLDVRPEGELVDVDIEVDVSSGTYVRALARDLGAALGVGGHLTALRRTRVGRFDLADATPLDLLDPERPIPLTPLARAARTQLVAHDLTEAESDALGHGRRIPSAHPGEKVVAAFAPDGTLVAVVDESGAEARPTVVFAPR